jgi:hypothetical protein
MKGPTLDRERHREEVKHWVYEKEGKSVALLDIIINIFPITSYFHAVPPLYMLPIGN